MKQFVYKTTCLLLGCMFVGASFVGCTNGNQSSSSGNENPSRGMERIIVENGESAYKIVKSENASECENFAAEELQIFLNESCGIALPIVTDTQTQNSDKIISVGKTSCLENSGIEINYDELEYDGFVIQTKDEDIYIDGARDRATLYGVYDFLEKYVGIRFLTNEYTHIPELEKLSVYDLNEIEVPDFQLRSYWMQDTQNESYFAAKKRMICIYNRSGEKYGGGYYDDLVLDGHNTLKLLREGGLNFQDHPECYSELSGVRQNVDICWTHGIKDDGMLDESMEYSVAKALIKALKQRVVNNPDAKFFMIGHEDFQYNVCSCVNCVAIRQRFGGTYSAPIIRMVNLIAKEVNEWAKTEQNGRAINIIIYAYEYSEQPPVKINDKGEVVVADEQVRPHENVYIWFAPLKAGNQVYSWIDSRQNQATINNFQNWLSITDNVLGYMYTTQFSFRPWYIANMTAIADNIRYFKEKNMTEFVQCEGGAGLDEWQADLKAYVFSKVMWDVEVNQTALVEEFFDLLFESHAEKVKDAYYTIEFSMERIKEQYGAKYHMYGLSWAYTDVMQAKYYPIGALEKMVELLSSVRMDILNDNSLAKDRKENMLAFVDKMLLTPRSMIHTNYTSYYGTYGRKEYAYALYEDLEKIGYLGGLKSFGAYVTDFMGE